MSRRWKIRSSERRSKGWSARVARPGAEPQQCAGRVAPTGVDRGKWSVVEGVGNRRPGREGGSGLGWVRCRNEIIFAEPIRKPANPIGDATSQSHDATSRRPNLWPRSHEAGCGKLSTMWRWLCIVLAASACSQRLAGEPVEGTGAETSEAADATSGDPELAASCPAKLGEVASCECAEVSTCELSPTTPNRGECSFRCDLPSPCEPVTCSFATSSGGCDHLDEESLDCVFSALSNGTPMEWKTIVSGTSGFTYYHDSHRVSRVNASTYVVQLTKHRRYDLPGDVDDETLRAFEGSASALIDCDHAGSNRERFYCLHNFASQDARCADLDALRCPR